jgi:hypothetical protein
MNYNRTFHTVIDAFSEILILSIPVFIYLFFIIIRIYSGQIADISLEMSLMSIIYYADSVLIVKKLTPGSLSMGSNVLLIILIIFSSSLFTLELLSNGTHTATIIDRLSIGASRDMQVANTVLIITGFATNFLLRIIVSSQCNDTGDA